MTLRLQSVPVPENVFEAATAETRCGCVRECCYGNQDCLRPYRRGSVYDVASVRQAAGVYR